MELFGWNILLKLTAGQKRIFWEVINFLSLLAWEKIFASNLWVLLRGKRLQSNKSKECFNSISSLSDFLQLQVYFLCSAPPSTAFQLSEHTKISKMKVAPPNRYCSRTRVSGSCTLFSGTARIVAHVRRPERYQLVWLCHAFLVTLICCVVLSLRRMTSRYKYFVSRGKQEFIKISNKIHAKILKIA